MKHLAAYLLLTLAGNTAPSATDIKEVLGSVGIEADEERLNQLLTELEGKDIDELIAAGSTKLATTIGSRPTEDVRDAAPAESGDDDDDLVEGGSGDDCGDEDEDLMLGLFG
ncbi:hypothetical protein BJX64DRAFT_286393 [Aspergillus heterothallicus]